jgi:hypothetical protein
MPGKPKSSDDTRSIDMDDEYAIDFWTRELSVTQTKLKAAVEAVGTSVADVRRELKR